MKDGWMDGSKEGRKDSWVDVEETPFSRKTSTSCVMRNIVELSLKGKQLYCRTSHSGYQNTMHIKVVAFGNANKSSTFVLNIPVHQIHM